MDWVSKVLDHSDQTGLGGLSVLAALHSLTLQVYHYVKEDSSFVSVLIADHRSTSSSSWRPSSQFDWEGSDSLWCTRCHHPVCTADLCCYPGGMRSSCLFHFVRQRYLTPNSQRRYFQWLSIYVCPVYAISMSSIISVVFFLALGACPLPRIELRLWRILTPLHPSQILPSWRFCWMICVGIQVMSKLCGVMFCLWCADVFHAFVSQVRKHLYSCLVQTFAASMDLLRSTPAILHAQIQVDLWRWVKAGKGNRIYVKLPQPILFSC